MAWIIFMMGCGKASMQLTILLNFPVPVCVHSWCPVWAYRLRRHWDCCTELEDDHQSSAQASRGQVGLWLWTPVPSKARIAGFYQCWLDIRSYNVWFHSFLSRFLTASRRCPMQRLRLVTMLLRIGILTNWQVSYSLHTVLCFPSTIHTFLHRWCNSS